MSDTVFTLPAFAKINLVLRVLGRRPDGLHEVRTILQTITLHDLLTFEPVADEQLELSCSEPGIPGDESNLVYKAALALRERYGVRRGARVTLEKRIPAQGGLGGGSSDAAVALVGLARLWEIEADKTELAKLGARLGADVPFFLTGGTASGTGTGADIEPLEDAQRQHLVVVTPGAKVSTAEAYKALNARALTKAESPITLSVSRDEASFAGPLSEVMCNDFEAVVLRLQPEIARARVALNEAGARRAMLSGSGSSVFGIFDSEAEAGVASAALSEEAGWRVFSCATLRRAEYLKAFGKCAAVL